MPSDSSRFWNCSAEVRDDDAAEIQPDVAEGVDEAQGVLVIGDAEVAAVLAALDIVGRDGDDYLRLVLHFQQHTHLAVRMKARQHAGSMIIVKELSAELKIQLPAEFRDPVADVLRLQLHIFVIIKANCTHKTTFPSIIYHIFSDSILVRILS